MRGFFFLLIVALFAFAVYTPPSPVNIPTPTQVAVTEQPAPDKNDNVWEAGIPADIVMRQEAALEDAPPAEDPTPAVIEENVAPEKVSSEVVVPEDVAIETEVIDPVLVLSEEENEEIAPENVEPKEEVNIVEELIQE